jgi:hypothetical protein
MIMERTKEDDTEREREREREREERRKQWGKRQRTHSEGGRAFTVITRHRGCVRARIASEMISRPIKP